MNDNKRTFRIDIDKEFLDKVEEQFCFAYVLDEKVRVRTLTSVCTEAVLTGVLDMIDDLKALRKQFGRQVFLKPKGIGFAELSLDEPESDEEPSELVRGAEH